MARNFSDGFPGQGPGKGNSPVSETPDEAPPVGETPPVNVPSVTDPDFEPATGLPMIPAEQALEHVPFEQEDGFPGEPEFLDFF